MILIHTFFPTGSVFNTYKIFSSEDSLLTIGDGGVHWSNQSSLQLFTAEKPHIIRMIIFNQYTIKERLCYLTVHTL